MRYYSRNRPRPLASAAIAVAAACAGLAVMIGPNVSNGSPAIYVSGLQSADHTIWIASGLALAFSLTLLMGERRQRDRKFLGRKPNGRANLLATLRPLAVILGAAAIIVGALATFYAGLRALAPSFVAGSELPLSFPVAMPLLIVGALIYAAGRFERN